jgi:hypothetical protein
MHSLFFTKHPPFSLFFKKRSVHKKVINITTLQKQYITKSKIFQAFFCRKSKIYVNFETSCFYAAIFCGVLQKSIYILILPLLIKYYVNLLPRPRPFLRLCFVLGSSAPARQPASVMPAVPAMPPRSGAPPIKRPVSQSRAQSKTVIASADTARRPLVSPAAQRPAAKAARKAIAIPA